VFQKAFQAEQGVIMTTKERNKNDMPDVPEPDFVGALCEIWSALNSAAYHLAYTRVYLQTAALQTDRDQLIKREQAVRDMTQIDVIICRAHLASFFWQLDHVFEALRVAITRGKKEHPTKTYFWNWEKWLKEIETRAIPKEISAYRNRAHTIPAIIGCAWDGKGGKFLRHFLPRIAGHTPKDPIDINVQLQQYFEYVVNVWLHFTPGKVKDQFPRDFKFPVTVPNSFIGELPPELEGVPQFHVLIEASKREDPKVSVVPESNPSSNRRSKQGSDK
jgi:hypothetical protein